MDRPTTITVEVEFASGNIVAATFPVPARGKIDRFTAECVGQVVLSLGTGIPCGYGVTIHEVYRIADSGEFDGIARVSVTEGW